MQFQIRNKTKNKIKGKKDNRIKVLLEEQNEADWGISNYPYQHRQRRICFHSQRQTCLQRPHRCYKGNKTRTAGGNIRIRKIPTTDWDSKERLKQWRENWAVAINNSLEKKGLAQSISTEHEALGSSLVFKLIILPTNKGIQKIDELLSCIFQYISLIKKHGLSLAKYKILYIRN